MFEHSKLILFGTIFLVLLTGCSGAATVPPALATQIPTSPTVVPTPTSAPPTLQVTFTCNDGFILSASGKKILTDALIQETRFGCQSSAEETAAMEEARPPFDNIDLVLVSHTHSDHFAPQLIGSYLKNNPKAIFVSMDAVVEKLKEQSPDFAQVQERVRGVQLDGSGQAQMSFEGIDLEIFSAPADVPNLAFLIRVGGFTLFHSGDSDSTPEIKALFQSYQLPAKGIDIAFVPWWLVGETGYQYIVEEGIQAKYYVPMHFAAKELPNVSKAISTCYPEALLFQKEMETLTYPLSPSMSSRTLNYQALMNGFEANSPVDNGEMAPPIAAGVSHAMVITPTAKISACHPSLLPSQPLSAWH